MPRAGEKFASCLPACSVGYAGNHDIETGPEELLGPIRQEATRVPSLLLPTLGVRPNLQFASPQPDIFFAQLTRGRSSSFSCVIPSRNRRTCVWGCLAEAKSRKCGMGGR